MTDARGGNLWGLLRAVFWLWYTKPEREKRRRGMAARIVALERELFPDLYQPEPRDDPETYSFKPGARWLVTDPKQVTFYGAQSMSAAANYTQVIQPELIAQLVEMGRLANAIGSDPRQEEVA
jgi:hypothetical protein